MEVKELGNYEVPSLGLGTEVVCCLVEEIRLLESRQSPNSHPQSHWKKRELQAFASVESSSSSAVGTVQPSVVSSFWEKGPLVLWPLASLFHPFCPCWLVCQRHGSI